MEGDEEGMVFTVLQSCSWFVLASCNDGYCKLERAR